MADNLSPLLNAIEAHEAAANRLGDLSHERTTSFNAYLGKPYGNEVEGRSRVVSHDVADTIEWIKPSMMRIFASGDEIVSFDPKGEEDVEAAQQESDYTNYILTQKNQWFRTAYVWFTDALMQKNAYVKAWWETKKDVTTEKYQGLSEDQVAIIFQDPEVEITKNEVYPDPSFPGVPTEMAMALQAAGQPLPQAPQLYDIECKRTSVYGCAKYKEIPPERVLVSAWAQSIDLEDVDFFEHFEWKTLSDLRAEGLEVPESLGDESGDGFLETEEETRNLYGEPWTEAETNDPASKRYKVREVWIKFDDDGDGIAELRHVIVIGKTELLNETAEFIPAAAITPKMMPHRHVGRSIADEVMDLQEIKTTLLRGTLDNMYLQNNGRYGVDEQKVNLDDMLTSRPGGLVRTNGSPLDKIMPFAHPNMMPAGLQAIEYVDTIKQNRTGVTAYVTSVDGNVLNETASGTQMLQNAAMAKIELIARVFAETGVKRLMWLIHALTLKNATKAEKVRLRNKWVTVDPRGWKNRADMTVSVGLGTGNRDQQLVHLGNILGLQEKLIPLGLVTKKNVRHATGKFIQAAGFKDPESFLAPQPQGADEVENQPIQMGGPPDPAQQEMVKQRAETERTVFKEGEETKRKQMDINSKEAIEMARIASGERTAQFQAEHAERVKGAELQQQAQQKDKEIGAQQRSEVFKAQREDQVRAQEQAVNDPLETFTKAAEQVIKKAETTQGQESIQVLMAGMKELVQAANSAKEIVRDSTGRAVGVRPAK